MQKTQIAFSNRRQFAFASFLPVSAEWNRCFLKRRYKQKAECLQVVCASKLGYAGEAGLPEIWSRGVHFMGNEKIYEMDFSKVYHLLVNKAERKGRTRREVDEVIRWLTGYSQPELEGMLERPVPYGDFFWSAPKPNENRRVIKGVVCGVRVEDIEEPLMREIRYLDKLVDELARGKAMDKILRK